MTLVLSLTAPLFVVQVSDRRLTQPGTGNVKSEVANKAVFFCNRVSFGYTGIAVVSGQATDEWLASTLGKIQRRSLRSVLYALADRACAETPKGRRLAFTGIGWTHSASELNRRPFYCLVSNFHDPQFRPYLAGPRDTFSVGISISNPPWVSWGSVGVELLSTERKWLQRQIDKWAKRGLGPWSIVALFGSTIRSVAKRTSAVGMDLMVSILPRSAGESGGALSPAGLHIAPPASRGESQPAIFLYVSADSNSPVAYAPCVVAPDFGVFSGFVEGLPIDDIVTKLEERYPHMKQAFKHMRDEIRRNNR